jgi:hypothetical protein
VPFRRDAALVRRGVIAIEMSRRSIQPRRTGESAGKTPGISRPSRQSDGFHVLHANCVMGSPRRPSATGRGSAFRSKMGSTAPTLLCRCPGVAKDRKEISCLWIGSSKSPLFQCQMWTGQSVSIASGAASTSTSTTSPGLTFAGSRAQKRPDDRAALRQSQQRDGFHVLHILSAKRAFSA